MLGAIVSHDDQVWFFKVAGPAEQVDKYAEVVQDVCRVDQV